MKEPNRPPWKQYQNPCQHLTFTACRFLARRWLLPFAQGILKIATYFCRMGVRMQLKISGQAATYFQAVQMSLTLRQQLLVILHNLDLTALLCYINTNPSAQSPRAHWEYFLQMTAVLSLVMCPEALPFHWRTLPRNTQRYTNANTRFLQFKV